MKVPVFNINKAGHGLIVAVVFSALNNIANIINYRYNRPGATFPAKLAIYSCRNINIPFHYNLIRFISKEVTQIYIPLFLVHIETKR